MKKIFLLASILSVIFFYGTFNLSVQAQSASPEVSEDNAGEENLVKDEQLKFMLNMMIFERDPDENIVRTDLESIEELSLTGMMDVSDWSWLEYCTNLTSLDLGNTNFSDARLIKSSKLTRLVLASTPLEHADALRDLINLESLNLSELLSPHDDDEEEHSGEHEHSALFDLSILSDMKSLKSLSIFEVELENAQSLSSLTNLEELDASMCEGFEINSLSSLSKLRSLHLSSVGAENIEALSSLTKLEILHLDNNKIRDISPIKGLTNLRELNLKNNPFTDISGLEGLNALINLDISKNSETADTDKISDISALSSLINITDLRIDYNKIGDISPLANMKNLKRINIANNDISKLDALKSLEHIVSIYASNNKQLSDIGPIAQLHDIGEIQINSCAIDDIKSLADIYNGDSIFIFNIKEQEIIRYIEEKNLSDETKIKLVEGNNVKYSLSEDIEGAKIEDNYLILPKGFEFKEAINISFEDSFDKSQRVYTGQISVLYKEAEENDTEDKPVIDDKDDTKPDKTGDKENKDMGDKKDTSSNKNVVEEKLKPAVEATSKAQNSAPKTGDSHFYSYMPYILMISLLTLISLHLMKSKKCKNI